MQGQEQGDGSKSSGNPIGMGSFGHQPRPSFGGLRDRQGGSMPPINTSRASQHVSAGDMQTPGTGYDLSFSALLPSQLLVGSPFATTTPQFQGFPNFPQTNSGNHQTQSSHLLGSPVQQQPVQHPLSPQLYQGMNLNSALAGGASFGANQPFQQQHVGSFGGYGNQMGSQINPGLVSGTSRTVYLGNIPSDATAEEILGHVRSGQIESMRLLLDKNCAFISFLDGSSAVHFHSDAILKKLSIRGQDIKVGWGKPSQVPSSVALAIQQSGASRNVYLGNLPTDISEEELREDLSKFGPIDTIKLVREKAIGFVHFLSISNAIKAVTQLPQESKWQPPRRVFYGKDRCAYVSKTQQQNAAQYLGIAPGYANVLNTADRDLISNALAQQSVAAAAVATAAGGANNLGNRTVYLGNIHPETTSEEICNVVRGGLLHHIRYIPDKHICFVTFIDPTSAASFFALSNVQGLMIHNRRLKIGWGKHSGALPPAIALAVSGGASRNVYIGNIDDSWSEERLRQDFSEYGEIELVNALREKSCAFVNFTNIANAIKAIEGIRGKDEYKRFKINFGKDRCGNPPRQMNNNSNSQNAANAQTGFNTSTSTDGVTPPPHAESQHGQNGVGGSNNMSNGALHSLPGVTNSNNNPLTQYLSQLSQSLQHQHTQPHHFNSSLNHLAHQSERYSPQHPFDADAQDGSQMFGRFPYDTPSPQNSDHQQPPQSHYSYHGSSNSFTGGLATNHSATPSTVGGFLAPSMGMSASQKSQHARALSMPAFSQIPPTSHHSKISHSGGIGALTSGLGGLGLGPTVNGYSTAENTLPRWAEEEVGSS